MASRTHLDVSPLQINPLSRGLSRLGSAMAEIAERDRKLYIAGQVLEFDSWATQRSNEVLDELQRSSFHDLNDQKVKDFSQEIEQRLSQTTDAEAQLYQSKTAAHMRAHVAKGYQDIYRAKQQDWVHGTLINTKSESLRALQNSSDAREQRDIIDHFLRSVDVAIEGGFDPSRAEAMRAVFRDKVDQILSGMQKDGKIFGTYNLLYAETGGDFRRMGEMLNSPETLQRYSLSLDEGAYLKGYIEKAQRDADQALKATHDVTAKDFFLKLGQGRLTPSMIDNSVRNGEIDWKTAEHFKQEIKSGREGSTDPMTYYRLFTAVHSAAGDPERNRALRGEIIRSAGLSFTDKKALLAKTEGEADKIESQWRTKAAGYLKDVVMPSQTMISAAKPEEAYQFYRGLQALDEGIAKLKQSGKPLTGQLVQDLAVDIGKAYRLTLPQQIQAVQERIRADMEKGAVARPADGEAVPKREKGESLEAYLIRTGQK